MKIAQLTLFLLASVLQVSVKAWEVDLSRRQADLQKFRGPASVEVEKQDKNWIEGLFNSAAPTGSQDVVILLTEKGFVPETIRLKKGQSYNFHIVNVNEKDKNTSFVMDSFSESHGIYYGQKKDFQIQPKANGIFSYVCPETNKQGKLIIYSDDQERKPASR